VALTTKYGGLKFHDDCPLNGFKGKLDGFTLDDNRCDFGNHIRFIREINEALWVQAVHFALLSRI
jgi:hypothetical protein